MTAPRGAVIAVPQADGEIVVTTPGVSRLVLPVVDGRVTTRDDATTRAVITGVAGAQLVVGEDVPSIDPDTSTVAEVNAYLDQHPDQAADVLAAERNGRARVGILDGPHAPTTDTDPAAEPAAE